MASEDQPPTHAITVGVLEAGSPPPALADRFGGYAAMVARLLGPGFAVRAYDVRAGRLPDSATECDAWLVTGSSSGVYDGDAWIAGLKAFLQRASGQAPMVGICFGHQLMAEAFGGAAAKSPKGWGIGQHTYAIPDPAPWMDGGGDIRLAVSHQDQVTAVGEGAQVHGGSGFTKFGVLSYPARRAFSIQAHPEFGAEYAQALIEHRRGTRFDHAAADAAVATFAAANDSGRVAAWLRAVLSGAAYPSG